MLRSLLFLLVFFSTFSVFSQPYSRVLAEKWADSVIKTLSEDEKIAQLMVIRVSSIGPERKIIFYEQEVLDAIRRYNIGSVCLFQGGPLKQASMVNAFQAAAKTPILVTIDGENGLGMRMDSVMGLPRQMMLGAVQDPNLIYQYGRIVGEQCRRAGIQVNYAPVVDVNNNPANPVINDRSFGEDKYRVAHYGLLYMQGMQSVGIMSTAKHFPGHGDVSVDSHYDLPVVSKSRRDLDSLELYPFRRMIEGGVPAVMVAHLNLPAIDKTQNRASSISKKVITDLLRKELKFKGLTFTDALEMKGVSKFYSPAELSAEALIAGNDMLCLPGDIPGSIEAIKKSISRKKLSWKDINERVRKLLIAKYQYGLARLQPVSLENRTEDLNKDVPDMRRRVAEHAITLLRKEDGGIFPLKKGKRVAYVGFGLTKDNVFAQHVREDYDAQVYYFDYKLDSSKVQPVLDLFRGRYDVVIVGMHAYSRFPGSNFGVSEAAMNLIQGLNRQHRTVNMIFGNPYMVKNFCDSRVLVACYEDDEYTQQAAADLLNGRFEAKGKLPVTACPEFKLGDGIVAERAMPEVEAASLGFNEVKLMEIDSIVEDAIQKKAIPGAVVLVAKDGKIAYEKSFGYQTYDKLEPVYPETIYDLASVTKVMATTAALMKLYDEKRLDINRPLGYYVEWVRGSNKEDIILKDLLLHQAGLQAWIPFYRETVDARRNNKPVLGLYSPRPDTTYSVRVAENMYMRKDWLDSIKARILSSPVAPRGKYVYSDLDFIFLGEVVQSITGQSLDEYVQKTFYEPLGMSHTGFSPRNRYPLSNIAPTEKEEGFRMQLLLGDVHDPGAAMMGGVAGHAGLFGTAGDLAIMLQMMLNKGSFGGHTFFSPATMDLFNRYYNDSRRGLGFDKPDQDNSNKDEPYPTLSASPATFGHTGFTGTCIWADPAKNLIYVFLSNRVNNNGDANRFLRMNVRPKVHEVIYEALK
jgi:beta-glucosidase-like glycosyl hydrolase/CubicO group peptidase (beta-lactamase class C family)